MTIAIAGSISSSSIKECPARGRVLHLLRPPVLPLPRAVVLLVERDVVVAGDDELEGRGRCAEPGQGAGELGVGAGEGEVAGVEEHVGGGEGRGEEAAGGVGRVVVGVGDLVTRGVESVSVCSFYFGLLLVQQGS